MKEIEISLIRQAKAGDSESFAKLYECVYEDLYRFALYTLANHEDACDAVADTVLDAFREIRSLRNEAAFFGWIFRILSNKCRARMRGYVSDRAHRSPMDLSEELLYLSAQSTQDTAEDIAVRDAFFHLPETDRMILAMHLFAGFKSREIAHRLSMNASTVRSREKRALASIRKELERESS